MHFRAARFGHVVFGEQYFDFADPDAEGAVPVFVVIARAWDGVTDDVVAFDAQGRFSTLLGRANLLASIRPRPAPLPAADGILGRLVVASR